MIQLQASVVHRGGCCTAALVQNIFDTNSCFLRDFHTSFPTPLPSPPMFRAYTARAWRSGESRGECQPPALCFQSYNNVLPRHIFNCCESCVLCLLWAFCLKTRRGYVRFAVASHAALFYFQSSGTFFPHVNRAVRFVLARCPTAFLVLYQVHISPF